jgi:hypothetical protein
MLRKISHAPSADGDKLIQKTPKSLLAAASSVGATAAGIGTKSAVVAEAAGVDHG